MYKLKSAVTSAAHHLNFTLTPWSRACLGRVSLGRSRNSARCMEPEGSLPRSPKSTTCTILFNDIFKADKIFSGYELYQFVKNYLPESFIISL